MAVPKKKTSHARKGTRRAHQSFTALNLSKCPQCKQEKPSHQICPNCGYYKGKEALKIKTKHVKRKTTVRERAK